MPNLMLGKKSGCLKKKWFKPSKLVVEIMVIYKNVQSIFLKKYQQNV